MAILVLLLSSPCVAAAQRPNQVAQRQLSHTTHAPTDLTTLNSSILKGLAPGERGALVGGVIGFAAGALLAIGMDEGYTGSVHVSQVLLVGLALAIPGLVIGGLIGSAAGKGKP